MKPSQIISALHALLDVGQPAFLWGPPGVGKSQVVGRVARERGLRLVDVRAVLLDPVDLRGLPRIDERGAAVWCAPGFLPRSGRGILFLDELNAAPPLVQAACYQLVLDRRLGEYELPEGFTVIAAGNRDTDRAATHRMPSALANRLVHLDFDADLDDWTAWAREHGLDQRLIAFLGLRPALLHDFDPTRDEKAFASPRSWEFVSRILGSGADQATIARLAEGAVGRAAASELAAYLRVCAELPDPEALLADPHAAPLPSDPDVLCALCEALARRASGETAPGLARLAARMPVEYGVLLMRDAAATHPAIVETEAFGGWARENSKVLM
jgi:MoxR-like ATPase